MQPAAPRHPDTLQTNPFHTSRRQDWTRARYTLYLKKSNVEEVPPEASLHLAVSLMKLGIFLHVTGIQSYFLRSDRDDMKHIFQIVGLLDFPNELMAYFRSPTYKRWN